MISKSLKAGCSMAVALAAAAALTVSAPSSAYAIDHVACDGNRNDLLKIHSHLDGRDSVDCYANAGTTDFGGWWVDEISTGNNDLVYSDANGDSVRVNRWTDITYPNRPPKVTRIQIL
ncbi:beta/gamma crystallin domain-containing protein [Kitasatospora viridis]|uniref:Beta/gamma crystallin n=1 Tax=Kitasatospora viridis TaxID=281105 RepID=A0A561UMY3_9ACTN|nr:beta/gamma crystallin domain-containing protein [Kitasatospora viridis]TWG00723.1 beta/gamma crystallin [Kitasatospora viridis]